MPGATKVSAMNLLPRIYSRIEARILKELVAAPHTHGGNSHSEYVPFYVAQKVFHMSD